MPRDSETYLKSLVSNSSIRHEKLERLEARREDLLDRGVKNPAKLDDQIDTQKTYVENADRALAAERARRGEGE